MTLDGVYLYEGKNSFSFEQNLVCEKKKKKPSNRWWIANGKQVKKKTVKNTMADVR